MNNYKIYIHICPNNKVYIGITSQEPKKRWCSGGNYTHNKHFCNAIKKYGWKNIKHEILYENLTKEEAEKKEIELICFYKSNNREYGYNIENGGNSNGKHSQETLTKISQNGKGRIVSQKTRKKISEMLTGRKLSEEIKRKMSETRKGRISPMKDKHLSIETRNKISNALKNKPSKLKGKHITNEHKEKIKKNSAKYWLGKHLNSETREKIRKANLGKKLSKQTCEKLSKIHKGHIVSEEMREKIRKSNLGKHHTEETKEKIRQAHLKKRSDVKLNSLKKYRYEHNLTQEEMAKLLGVSDSSYSLYENNKREMTYKTLIQFLELRNEKQDNVIISVLKEFLRKND